MRLLGDDPLIVPRQNSGFTNDDVADWKRWHDEDATYSAGAADADAVSRRARSDLALP